MRLCHQSNNNYYLQLLKHAIHSHIEYSTFRKSGRGFWEKVLIIPFDNTKCHMIYEKRCAKKNSDADQKAGNVGNHF